MSIHCIWNVKVDDRIQMLTQTDTLHANEMNTNVSHKYVSHKQMILKLLSNLDSRIFI